ncbi:hypothetical protein CONCODRAFT_11732 [Conidiobolus coronatus NRRL 28638]|uniref:Uncharacterized protein n=1 Tax=Conidiobolus coronatus (strain ATCC 28846 / CBS 209.66 / NRRL 28638) TaxID=796925 RepID=A0A137NUD7_CONC2|nr:hypothetical protein CONCODRAFT_11732 [Conidiobolus coronatus NRRL 28638]|eukprot:KXN66425.1 hypothetical protein CONCODRAFT_11732 [Conidiobolus coronatus NRRL 28638]
MLASFNLFLYIFGITEFTLSIVLNSTVFYITFHRLNPLQPDSITVLVIGTIDILFSLLNLIHITLNWSTKSEINSSGLNGIGCN